MILSKNNGCLVSRYRRRLFNMTEKNVVQLRRIISLVTLLIILGLMFFYLNGRKTLIPFKANVFRQRLFVLIRTINTGNTQLHPALSTNPLAVEVKMIHIFRSMSKFNVKFRQFNGSCNSCYRTERNMIVNLDFATKASTAFSP